MNIELKATPRVFFVNMVLAVIFTITSARLIKYAIQFGDQSLQMDFSAYYTAGESLNYGLSPYDNNVLQDPPIWDGVSRVYYSRFLYPPLTAAFFQLFVLLPYSISKFLWEFISLLCLIISLVFATKIFLLEDVKQKLLVGIASTLFFPLLICLERGQIDTLTLMLISFFIYFLVRGKRKDDWLSGLFLALASLLKLYCLYLLPFLLIRKRWNVVASFVGSMMLFVIVQLFLPAGKIHLLEYVITQVPAISGLPAGEESERIPERVYKRRIQAILENVPAGLTIKDGKTYQIEAFIFSRYATLVKPVESLFSGSVSPAILSLGMYTLFFALFWSWYIGFNVGSVFSPKEEYVYWLSALMVVLLASPLTWVMNTVWIIPASVVVISEKLKITNAGQFVPLLFLIIGFLIAGISDASYSIIFRGDEFPVYKYIMAEILVFTGCIGLLTGWNKAGRSHA